MGVPKPPGLYRVVYSDAVKGCLREFRGEADARGDGPAFTEALAEFHRRLQVYPQFGDPLIDLEVGGGQIRVGTIRPLSMRYGVHEDRRIVFCSALPVLLPMDT